MQGEVVPTTYTTLGQLSIVLLTQRILGHLEPTVWSRGNLRALAQRGMREPSKANYCQLIEFATGCDCEYVINGQMRLWSKFLAYLEAQHVARGKRGLQIRLPPDWEARGLYGLAARDGEVWVAHRYTGQELKVPMALFPEGTKMEDLTVEANFSEKRARVTLKDGSLCEGFLLGGHFKQGSEACLVLASAPSQVRLALCLQDRPRAGLSCEVGSLGKQALSPAKSEGTDGNCFTEGDFMAELQHGPATKRLKGEGLALGKAVTLVLAFHCCGFVLFLCLSRPVAASVTCGRARVCEDFLCGSREVVGLLTGCEAAGRGVLGLIRWVWGGRA